LRTRLQLQRGRQGDHGRGDAERQAALVALAAHHLHGAPRLRRHEHGRRVRSLRAAAPLARARQARACRGLRARAASVLHAAGAQLAGRLGCTGTAGAAQRRPAWTLVLADSMVRIMASHTRRAAGQIRAPDRGGVGAARVAAVAHHQGRAAAQVEGNGVGAPAPRVRHRGRAPRLHAEPRRAHLTRTWRQQRVAAVAALAARHTVASRAPRVHVSQLPPCLMQVNVRSRAGVMARAARATERGQAPHPSPMNTSGSGPAGGGGSQPGAASARSHASSSASPALAHPHQIMS